MEAHEHESIPESNLPICADDSNVQSFDGASRHPGCFVAVRQSMTLPTESVDLEGD
jgi:hypothetical protein